MPSIDDLTKQLELARRELLDVTTSNRLLDTPRDQDTGAALEIKDELASEIFSILVTEAKAMRFEQGVEVDALPGASAPDGETAAESEKAEKPKKPKRVTKKKATGKAAAEKEKEPDDAVAIAPKTARKSKKATRDDDEPDAPASAPLSLAAAPSSEAADRHSDDVLNTELAPEELDRRLLALVTDATACKQEKGINVLFLALGFLKWREPVKDAPWRHAPLLLVPVRLERVDAGTRYRLVYTGEPIETNLTLKLLLKNDYSITLPDAPEIEELSPTAYFQEVQKAIAGQSTWKVLPDDMVVWFFSFNKQLMYRDLDPANWPADCRLEERPMIRALLGEGFESAAPLCGDDEPIDPLTDPRTTAHVIDSDSSQTLVVEEACRGRSLVIQGPPGTGKSQTITNLIAAIVRAGKSVLFVAEKMAALQVVKRRLDKLGLGDMCLELHSDMASGKTVLDEVGRVLRLGRPKQSPDRERVISRLKEVRDQLNASCEVLHRPIGPGGPTPYQAMGILSELRAAGTTLPDFQLPGAEKWSVEQYDRIVRDLTDYVALTSKAGPQAAAWKGCKLQNVLPIDLERMLADVPKATQSLDDAASAAEALARTMGDDAPVTLDETRRTLRTARAIAACPTVDPQAMSDLVWTDHREAIRKIGDSCRAIVAAEESLKGQVVDSAWDVDVAEARQAHREYGQSAMRLIYSSYRAAQSVLASVLAPSAPTGFEERQKILDLLADRQAARAALSDADGLGAKAFGRFWIGKQTDWKRIAEWEAWDAAAAKAGVSPRFRELRAKAADVASLAKGADQLESRLGEFLERFHRLCLVLELVPADAFAGESSKGSSSDATLAPDASPTEKLFATLAPLGRMRVEDVRARLRAWQEQPEGLQNWQRMNRLRETIVDAGAGEVVEGVDQGKIPPQSAAAVLSFARHEAIFRAAAKQSPELAVADPEAHQKLVDEYRALDLERIALARIETAESHYCGIGRPRRGDLPQAASILRHEMQKKRRQLPLRKVLTEAGPAIQALKPVFMMSPMSVAQLLEPGAHEFDALVIDEASQVRPIEALGAAARARQMIVVGDDKQMPPTQFFGAVLGASVDDSEPAVQAADVESVLGLCVSRNMPQRMLRWHYRSRHQSLIAVSNKEFYQSQLQVIPSPERHGELGLKLHPIEGALFENGKNEVEAKVVAQAIIDHAQKRPQWTLGVAAFSVTQRDAILSELEKLRRQRKDLERFFDPNAPDPFFVKNLENVQGDERDVIFISCGYGPNKDGKVSLNFGPVSAAGGERRLNVLITRAKSRCEVFASLKAEDIDLARATGRGPAVLRSFLQFAQSGGDVDALREAKADDAFVRTIMKQLTDAGWKTQPRVGTSGIFVDLAVLDPDDPGRCLLGVELDGPSFRSSRTARDRERLREQILRGQGWNLHRIRAVEWFHRPKEQLARLLEAIQAAVRAKSAAKTSGGSGAGDVVVIDRHEPSADPLGALGAGVSPDGQPITDPNAPPPTVGQQVAAAVTQVATTAVEVGVRKGLEMLQDALKQGGSPK